MAGEEEGEGVEEGTPESPMGKAFGRGARIVGVQGRGDCLLFPVGT